MARLMLFACIPQCGQERMPYGHNRSPVCGRNLPLSVRHPGWMRFTEACLLKTENNMTTLSEPLVTPKYGKWRQLVLGLICMAAISSPQYVWTLLTKPPGRQTWRRSARIAGHLLAADHPADLLFPFSGAVSGKIWPTAADRYWHSDGGNELGAFRAGEWPGNALAGLWLHGRPRDRSSTSALSA